MTKVIKSKDLSKLFFQTASQIETHIVEITPKIASGLLEMTDLSVQRKLNKPHVNFLANELTKGDWAFNGDSIRQDCEGNLIDGQHRLNACIVSGISFSTLFVKGLPTEYIHTIDVGGKPRSLANALEINHRQNYKYSNNIAAACKLVRRLNLGSTGGSGAKDIKGYTTAAELLLFIKENPAFIEFISETMRLRANGDKFISPVIFCGVKWLTDKADLKTSNKFWQGLSDGIGINQTSSVWYLRKKIMRSKTRTDAKLTQRALIINIYCAFNSLADGKTLTKFFPYEKLPKLKSKKFDN
jgi:hypothetical protein